MQLQLHNFYYTRLHFHYCIFKVIYRISLLHQIRLYAWPYFIVISLGDNFKRFLFRNHGERQGVQVHLGIDDAIQYRWFANAIGSKNIWTNSHEIYEIFVNIVGNWSWCNSTGIGCRCCRFEPQIHVCKPKSGETFPTF